MTDFWDEREPNTPADDHLGTAIQVWSVMEDEARDGTDRTAATVGEAAAVFNVTPRRAARAVLNFPWTFLRDHAGDTVDGEADLNQYADEFVPLMIIEHDGE